MTKKRITVMVIFSPIILAGLVCIAFASCVGYAIDGEWELRELVREWKH